MDKKMICHNCKAELMPGTSFCPWCGTRITDADLVSDSSAQYNPAYLQPGTILQNKYRINHVIGQGGFGITYDGTDLKLNMHVAIKEYFPRIMASRQTNASGVTCSSGSVGLYEHGLRNFIDEARNMARFAGEENFVAVHDYFTENNTAYIIMEFVEGMDLKQYLRQRGRLSMKETLAIITPVMQVLETIHSKGMIHRDVSPSNIMILKNGRVRLLDFGAARDVSPETMQMTTMSAVYKFGYSPIEQLTNGMKQGPFTDIYALCATVYEMLTGTMPPSPFQRNYEGAALVPPSQYGADITAVQERALLKGLEINGEDRIQTVAELRRALLEDADTRPQSRAAFVPFAGRNGNQETGSYGGAKSNVGGRGGGSSLFKVILCAAVAVLIAALGLAVYLAAGNRRNGSGSSGVQAQGGGQPGSDADSQNTGGAQADEGGELRAQADDGQEQAAEDENVQASGEQSETEAQTSDSQSGPEEHYADGEGTGAAISHSFGNSSGNNADRLSQYDIPAGALVYNGHSYYVFNNEKMTFDDAQAYCESRGGYLAVINNSGENEALYQYMVDSGYSYVHFGYTDRDQEGTWEWVGNDTSSFEDWGMNDEGEREPNSDTPKEDYAVLSVDMSDGHWNDSQYGWNSYAYICEWDGTN